MDDLSDSAIASPYEKPVSFKDEVHLFSPRESPAKCEYCVDVEALKHLLAPIVKLLAKWILVFHLYSGYLCQLESHEQKI